MWTALGKPQCMHSPIAPLCKFTAYMVHWTFSRCTKEARSVGESTAAAFVLSPAASASVEWSAFGAPHLHSPKLMLCMFTSYFTQVDNLRCAKVACSSSEVSRLSSLVASCRSLDWRPAVSALAECTALAQPHWHSPNVPAAMLIW